MKIAEERLRFVVAFAEKNLDGLRPGDWLNLRDELGRFLGDDVWRFRGMTMSSSGGPIPIPQGDPQQDFLGFTSPLEPPLPEDYPEEGFRALQREVRELLKRVVDVRDDVASSSRAHYHPLSLRLSVAPRSFVRQTLKGGVMVRREGIFLTFAGSVRDAFLMTLALLVVRVGTERILRCAECSRIFVRVRRQERCSRACTNKAGFRRWLQTPKGRRRTATQAAAARARYERKIKERVGPGARPRRNSRKPSQRNKGIRQRVGA